MASVNAAGSDHQPDKSFDDFMRWSVPSLKEYLRKVGLKVSGSKADLAARAFAAWEMDLPAIPTKAMCDEEKAADYESSLTFEGTLLPDPRKLSTGWLGEKEGMQHWPPTMYFDIGDFLGVKNIDTRMLQDYKEGKGFSYHQSSKAFHNCIDSCTELMYYNQSLSINVNEWFISG